MIDTLQFTVGNLKFVGGSMTRAAEYIRDKFPNDPAAQEFYQRHRYRKSGEPDAMGSAAFEYSRRKMPEIVMSEIGNGFAYFQEFFHHEMRHAKGISGECGRPDAERATEIYRDLMMWGCFDADLTQQERLPVQDILDAYVKKNKPASPPKLNFNINAKPDFYKTSYEIDYKGKGDDPSTLHNKCAAAVLAVADAQGRLDEIKCFFYHYDHQTEKGYIDVISTTEFKHLVSYICPPGGLSGRTVSFNNPDTDEEAARKIKAKAPQPKIDKISVSPPLKRRKKGL